ncbi:trichohyalin-like [Neodiprion pinetum]|uniref:trichohyalin-like n=1 Tax=Neodiprion pinetum TaxID=441929 RepID=UPI0037229B91
MSNAGGRKEGANREEKEKKKGRPGAVAALGRDRRHSLGSTATVLDLWKREREEEGEKGEEEVDELQERERVFGKSRKVHRSPEGKTGEEGKAEGGGIQDMLRFIREELKIGLEEVKGQGRGIREEMEKIKGEMTRREEQWEVERGEMKEMIRDLGKRLEEVEERRRGEMERVKERLIELEKKSAEGGGERQVQGNAEVAQVTIDRLKEMEWAIERKEREERRGNIVVRGARLEKGREKEESKKILQLIGVEVEVKDMWEVGAKKGEEKGIWIARLGNREHKRQVMGRKSLLKGREERIDEDLTWAERRMKWKLREVAAIEERRGNRWDEIGEVLRDGTGRAREEGQREGRGKLGESDRERSASEERQEGSIEAQERIEKKGWERIRNKLPVGYKWEVQYAVRKNRKGRAIGGMLSGVRREIVSGEGGREEVKEGMIARKISVGGEKWVVVGIYVNGELKEKIGELKERAEKIEGGVKVLVGGDFNARTGQEGGGCWGEGEEESRSRKSKDRKINSEGRQLVQFLEETGWAIMNGNMEGDEEGEFTYVEGAGATVIDYAIGDIEVRYRVKRIEIGDRVDSDHQPVIVWLRGAVTRTRKGKRVGATSRGDWTEEGRMRFRTEVKWEGIGEVDVGKEIEKRIRELRRALDVEGRGREAKKGWLCEERKKKENEGFIKEAAEARTESKVWEIVNRERKKWKRVNEEIGDQEWREYFMGLLGRVESKVTEGGESVNRKGDGEGELQREEIKKVIGKLRDGKAPGGDGIVSEVWRYGGEEMEQRIWKTCNRVWVGEGWPEDWREGLIAPIVKKGEGKRVEEYRGVTLMPTLYKVYAMALADRLEREVEEKGLIPQNQTGFRKGMSTIDNIYVLIYLINRQVGKDKGKMVAFFVDLKAAFDSVNRKVLWETMERRGVREGLRVRIEEIYKETKSRVRSGGKLGEAFWTARGVRQGYPLSPHVSNLLLADLEEEMGRGRRVGGVELAGGRVCTLAYEDDIVLLAESEEEMEVMIRKLERYMDRKRLTVNVGKSKIMRFRKGGGRRKNIDWRWKGKRIEEVKEFSYLGLVWTVIEYASEIWGWREWRAVEAVQDRFLRWTLGVDGRTPGYLVREELQREKLRIRAGRRAWNFERKLERGEGSELARRCWEEIRDKAEAGRQGSRWKRERESFFAERGAESREVVARRERSEMEFREIEEREREEQRKERWEKIRESRYNRWYRLVKREGIPGYLGKGWGESRWIRVARFRLGSEMKEARYWEEEEKRRCRVCGGEEETWEHVWERCVGWDRREKSWQEVEGSVDPQNDGFINLDVVVWGRSGTRPVSRRMAGYGLPFTPSLRHPIELAAGSSSRNGALGRREDFYLPVHRQSRRYGRFGWMLPQVYIKVHQGSQCSLMRPAVGEVVESCKR